MINELAIRFRFSKLRKIKKLKYKNKILKKLYKKEHELVIEKSLMIIELEDKIYKALEYIDNCIGIEIKEDLRRILRGDEDEI